MKSSPLTRSIPMVTAFGTFIFFAAMFAIPSGYSYGGALLLIASLVWLAQRPQLGGLEPQSYWMLAVLLVYFAIPSIMTLWLGNNVTDLDQYSRALLAVPIFLLLLHVPVRLPILWAAIIIGIVLSAPLAWWQIHIQHMDRAQGFLNIIHFSNLSLVFTAFCAAGLCWAQQQDGHRRVWQVGFITGIGCGLYSVIVGGSRGSWVALPPIVVIFLIAFLTRQNAVRVVAATAATIAIVAGLFALPNSPLQLRYEQGVQDVTRYQEDQTDTSIGARFEMWRGALHNLQQKPILGWNRDAYTQALKSQIAHSELTPVALQFNDNLHNNYIQAWVFTGLPGLLALLALYGLPLCHFGRQLRATDLTVRVLACCGTSAVASYLCFSLTQVILRRNNGIMFYLLVVVILWGALHHARNPPTISVNTPHRV